MKIHTGIDIIEVSRISDAISNSGDHFLEKVFTKAEIDYCKKSVNSTERFAARFAAKEAFVKAIGTGFTTGVTLTMIEVQKDDKGKPFLVLHDVAKKTFDMMKVKSIDVSISHVKDNAVATVTILSKK